MYKNYFFDPFMKGFQPLDDGKELMDQWLRMLTDTKKKETDTAALWTELMQLWQNMAQSLSHSDSPKVLRDLLEQAGKLNIFAKEFADLLANCQRLDTTAKHWQTQLRQSFNRFQQAFTDTTADNQWSQFEKYCENWCGEGMMNYLNMLRPFSGAFTTTSAMPEWLQQYGEMFSADGTSDFSPPGVGPAREQYQQWQHSLQLWAAMQKAYHKVSTIMQAAQQRGFELMYERIVAQIERGESMENLRAVYDCWIDTQEDAFTEFVETEEYTQAYGEFINSLLRFQQQQRILLEPLLRTFGVPTMTAVTGVVKELHRLRKRQTLLEKSLQQIQVQMEESHRGSQQAPAQKENRRTSKKAVAKKTSARRVTRSDTKGRARSSAKARAKGSTRPENTRSTTKSTKKRSTKKTARKK